MSILNNMMLAMNRGQTNVGSAKLGYVTSSNPADSTVKVRLEPEGMETGFISYCTPWIGWFAPPQPGQMALVIFQENDKNTPIGCFVLYWNESQPPTDVALGEAIWQHASGSFIKLANSGKILINAPGNDGAPDAEVDVSGKKVVINAAQDVEINAPDGEVKINTPTTRVSNDLIVGGTLIADSGRTRMNGGNFETDGSINAQQDVVGAGISLHNHVHTDVEPGSGTSGPPEE